MNFKNRLRTAVGLLSLLLILISSVSIVNILALKNDADNILVDNYRTLEYMKDIQYNLSINQFSEVEKQVVNQENNITELGEYELTKELRTLYDSLLRDSTDLTTKQSLQQVVLRIVDMNMQAIQKKNKQAEKTAEVSTYWIVITASVSCFLALFIISKFPLYITGPIQNLSESIEKISKKNYEERVRIPKNNEFFKLAEAFNSMAEKIQAYDNSTMAKILAQKKRIETLVNSMQDPLIGLDEDVKLIFLNTEARRLLAINNDDIGALDTDELVKSSDLFQALLQYVDDEKRNNLEKQISIVKNEKEVFYDIDIQSIGITEYEDKFKKNYGYIILLRNVTDYKQLDFAKTNFIADVSHEFKTPIASLKMGMQLFENEQVGKLNDDQKKLLHGMRDDADRLLAITKELLNMSQVESGNIKLNIKPCSVDEIIEYAIMTTKNQANAKGIKVNVQMDQSNTQILADNEKTAWVLTNLLSNAIRYSFSDSSIDILVQKSAEHFYLSVVDYGQGIAEEYLEKIFMRYFRVPGTKKEGTGLGLAISKEFMLAQGASIRVASELGKGSTFELKFKKA